MPTPTSAQPPAYIRFLRSFPRLAGKVTLLVGTLVLLGWKCHWTQLVQLLPDTAPTQFNSALGFALCGLGLLLLTTRHAGWARGLGGAVSIFASLTLLEYLTGRNFGIDQLFFHTYLQTATEFPGRMSPLTAICLTLVGTSLALAGWRTNWRLGLAGAGLLACIAGIVAALAVLGYAFGIEAAYGWGAYSQMALLTALLVLLLSSGLLAWSWQAALARQFDFFRWMPTTSSVTLLMMIGFVSVTSMVNLREAVAWRRHTYEVLNTADGLIGSLTDTQRGMRGYVLTADSAALEPYRTGATNAPQQLTQLLAFTRDNPAQQARLKSINTEIQALLVYSQKLIQLRDDAGLQAAVAMEKTGEGRGYMDRARANLATFTEAEHALLIERDLQATKNFKDTTRLLLFGSLMATALLLLANWLTNRETRRRQRAEETHTELNTQLAVTTAFQAAILNGANYAIISTSPTGVVTTFNATAERWLGYTAEEIIGKTTPAIWHEAAEVVARAKVLSAELGRPIEPGFEVFVVKAKLGQVNENEWTFIRKDGRRFPVTLSATALMDATGKVTGYLGMIADITERKQIEEVLQQQRTELRLLLDFIPAMVCFKDTHNKILRANQRLAEPLGKTVAEVEGRATEEFYPQDAAKFYADDLEVIRSGMPKLGIVETFQNQRNETVWLQTDKAPVFDTHGKTIGLVVMAQDITQRRQAEERMRESEERFRSAFDGAPIGIALVSPAGRWLQVNRALCELLGYTEVEFLATDFQHITHPDDLKKDWDSVLEVLAGKILSYQMEKRYFRKDGAVVSVMLSVSLVRKEGGEPLYFISQIENITERKQAEQKIAKSLQEKEALLREIHHRVKNNMQVISSILQLQTNYIKDAAALEVFKDCQGRIRTMALIHEQLYRSEDLARIDFKEYLESLVSLLLRSQVGRGVNVRSELQIEPVTLDADTAIPLGLIANELVSNCLKHAFTGRRAGLVRVTLRRHDSDAIQLIVHDDGHGLPPDFDPEKTNTLGVRLVKILSSQIKSRLEFKSEYGAEFTITFNSSLNLNQL